MLVLFALLVAGVWYGVHAWLESAGGRDALGAEISRRAGVPVELGQAFEVVLYPSIGAGGDGLRIGGEAGGEPFLSADVYEVSVALKPLWNGEIVIEAIRLESGWIDFSRLPAADPGSRGSSGLQLPTVDRLEVRDFQLRFDPEQAFLLDVERLQLDGFRPGLPAPLELELARWGEARAQVNYDPEHALLRLDDVSMMLLGAAFEGRACLDLQARPALWADLAGDRLQADEFIASALELLPADAGPGVNEATEPWQLPEALPLDLQARLRVGRLTYGDSEATGASLSVGPESPPLVPACGMTGAANPIQ